MARSGCSCAEGRRVLPGRPAADDRRLPRRPRRPHGPRRDGARRRADPHARRARPPGPQGEVPRHVLQQPRGERPRGRSHLPVRRARRVVRRRRPGLPAHRAGLELLAGRDVPRGPGSSATGSCRRRGRATSKTRTVAPRRGSPSRSPSSRGIAIALAAGADGTVSGVLYQWLGLQACLRASAAVVLAAGVLSRALPGVSARSTSCTSRPSRTGTGRFGRAPRARPARRARP
jgi:hypothetical protein